MPAKRKKVTGFGVQQSTSDSVTLSWNANPAAGGYRLYRATSEKGTYKLLKNITGNAQTTYTDTKRTLGKTYYYKIRMYMDVPGGSRLYGGWAYTKGQTSLETTTMTGALGKAGAVQVSWKKLAKADGYALYRSQNAQKGYTLAAELKGANKLEYMDTGLTAGTVWYYKVAPYVTVSGKKYYAAYTEPVSATVLPVQTSIASLTPGGGRMQVTWNAVPDASGYEVYAAYAKDGSYSKQFETTDRTVCSFMHTPKYAKREYFYKVRAFVLVNGQRLYADFSAPYSAISYKHDVILTSAVWDADAPVLGWKTNTAAAGYQLARSTAEDGEYVTLDADIPASGENSCTYTDTQATGEVLYYRIRLYEKNSDGVVIYGEWSEPYRVTKQTIAPEETEREPQAMPRTQQEETGVKQSDPEVNVTEQPAAEDEDVTEQPVTEEENVTEQSVTAEEDITGKTETA